jgi:FtsP/CotA-like multicopper oxidase with cupredoxin domain
MKKLLLLACLMLGLFFASKAQQLLLIPDTLSGTQINLEIRNGSKAFFPGTPTQTMGINGDILAPTLILQKHQNVSFQVKNNLTDTTTIHWHGMHVAPQNDGGPHITILPGTTWSPSFEVLDQASTHWYHPHLHMKTYDHVQKGIAGFIIVKDEDESKILLPRTYGVDDIPLAIQTKGIDANNQIITTHTALDTLLMVNGTINPYVNLPKQVVRLRVLNGSPERLYNLGFTANKTFFQIGSDGGLLSAPVALTRLLLAPGERAEILVNLSDVEQSQIELINYGNEIPNGRYGAAQPGMGAGQQIPNYSQNKLNGSIFPILKINITSATQNPVLSIPSSLITHQPWLANSANTTRSIVFSSMNMGPGAINGPFVFNNEHFDMDVINFKVPFDNIEIWELRNQSPIAHPFHLHNVQFYVLDINGAAPPLNLQGKKDVILVPPGNGTVRFITKFEDFYNDTLPYMYHCHMLTHEDDGMMGQFVVNAPCNEISKQPSNQEKPSGETVSFKIGVKSPAATSFQWQSNVGFGFQDLQNAGQYAGTQTDSLIVSNIAPINHNQQFRCKISTQTCNVISEMALLKVSTNSLSENLAIDNLNLFPNPCQETLNIQWNEAQVTSISITNQLGSNLRQELVNGSSTSLDISDLPAGLYIIKIETDRGAAFKRVIKQ